MPYLLIVFGGTALIGLFALAILFALLFIRDEPTEQPEFDAIIIPFKARSEQE